MCVLGFLYNIYINKGLTAYIHSLCFMNLCTAAPWMCEFRKDMNGDIRVRGKLQEKWLLIFAILKLLALNCIFLSRGITFKNDNFYKMFLC